MKLLNNMVAIRPFPADEIRLKGGEKLYLDIRFEEYLNAQTAGEVIGVPDRLVYNPKLDNCLDWDTDMEIQIGDTVIFNYLAVKNARHMMHIMEDGVVCMPYDKIYTVIRNGEIICVNGFILVAPEIEPIETFLEIPDTALHKSKQIGRVLYAGKPNRAYRMETLLTGHSGPDSPVESGSRVVFNWNDAIPIQPNAELRGEIKREVIYRMQHKDVHAIVPDEANVLA
jgi:hypothetical protein